MTERPLGVTIICILGLIGATLNVIFGASFIGLFVTESAMGIENTIGFSSSDHLLLGVSYVILGLAMAIGFIWLWQMKKIGWKIVIIVEIINGIGFFILFTWPTMDLIVLIIAAIIIAYLWVKKDLFK